MKKLLSILMCVIIAMTCIACTPTNSQQTPSQGDPIPDGIPEYTVTDGENKEEFFISAFSDPVPLDGEAGYEAWKSIADCHMNYVDIDPWHNTKTDEALIKALEMCERVGIKALVMANNATYTERDKVKSWSDYNINFKDYPAFAGMYAYDEPIPNGWTYDWILEDYATYKEVYGDYLYIVNIMSSHNGFFDEYQQEYYETVFKHLDNTPRYASFDSYGLQYDSKKDQQKLRDGFMTSWDSGSYYAHKYGGTFLNAIQACGYNFGEYRVVRSLSDIKWQVALSMAFGAKGFTVFPYCEVTTAGYTGSPMTLSGKKTDTWYWLEETFGECRSWENVFLAFDFLGTLTTDTNAISVNPDEIKNITRTKLDGHSRINSITAERDLVTGVFKDKNNYDAFMFVTLNDPYYEKYNKISVKFNNATKALIYINGERQIIDLTNGEFNWEISMSDMLFVIPIK